MKKYSAPNERIKREYFIWLKEAKGRNESSIDGVAKALNRFETYTRFRDFNQFHIEQARGFKAHLTEQRNERTSEPLSAATHYSTLSNLKAFFKWLADRPGYKSHISHADAEYFNLSEKETRIATAHRIGRAPTIEQIRHVLESMPAQSDIERRNRALIAFTLLTGARDGATASFKLKHIDIAAEKIEQDAREVKTKRSKTFTTWFFPVGDDIRGIVVDWVNFLQKEKLWGNADPLFPTTEMGNGADRNSKLWAWCVSIGAMPPRSERSLKRLSPMQGCRTQIRTASGTRSLNWPMSSGSAPRSLRSGAKTSAMKAF